MEQFEELVGALSRPEPWGRQGPVEVRRTHASVVFLVEDRAFKVKRPVDLGFLDFSTLERRRHFCEEEVRLNRRLAPGVYLGVRPIERGPDGPHLGGEGGPAVEWAVEMRRLDDRDTLASHLAHGTLDRQALEAVARRLARFHLEAARGPEIAAYGRREVVARNARENFEQTGGHVGRTVKAAVHERLRAVTERDLSALGPVFDRRAAAARDTHGDLRVDHVYLLPEGPVVIDCIEFEPRFRYADPVSDLAFLAMDMGVRGRAEHARALVDTWLEETGDREGRALLDFYVGYRSIVRAKVAGIALDMRPTDTDARLRARRHWLYALATLEEPDRRPALVGVGGLPGTGKSTLSAELAREAGFEVIRSDVVRHELAGPDTRDAVGQGAYSEAAKDHVYAVCLDRAERHLEEGRRVVVDASFWKERWRRMLLERASALGVPGLLLFCETEHERARERLRARTGDASDADEEVHAHAVAAWEAPAGEVAGSCRFVDANGGPADVLAAALAVLRRERLAAGNRATDPERATS